MTRAQALVPLKDLVTAKTRLSGVLSPGERRALAQAMVEDVLTVLTDHPQIERVTLVSSGPVAELLADKYNVEYLNERLLECRGLNRVIDTSTSLLLGNSAQPLIVLHGDIPLLSTEDIDAVLLAQRDCGGLVIGCDGAGVGTNLLAFNASSKPRFSFGIASCSKHSQSAREADIPLSLLHRKGISLDVDEPEDLGLLMDELRQRKHSHTAQLLLQTALGQRIETLLSSLDSDSLVPVNCKTVNCKTVNSRTIR